MNTIWKCFKVSIDKIHVRATHVSGSPNAVHAYVDLACWMCDLVNLLHERVLLCNTRLIVFARKEHEARACSRLGR
jgi:hypothetical protein